MARTMEQRVDHLREEAANERRYALKHVAENGPGALESAERAMDLALGHDLAADYLTALAEALHDEEND